MHALFKLFYQAAINNNNNLCGLFHGLLDARNQNKNDNRCLRSVKIKIKMSNTYQYTNINIYNT